MPSHIVASGAGRIMMENVDDPTHDFILDLTGKSRPRILFIGTAYGDHPEYALSFFETFHADRAYAARLKFFQARTDGIDELRDYVRSFDVIHIGGGNTAAMLAVWRAQGLTRILEDMWADASASYVFAGGSAGALCWFECGTSDSWGPTIRPIREGLGFLTGSLCPHYDGNAQRRPSYLDAVANGVLPPGYAIGNLDTLHFEGTTFVEAVSSGEVSCAYRVERNGTEAVEHALPVRKL